MNFLNFAAFVRLQTETDSTSLPNATLTLLANIAKDYVAEEIVQLDEDYFLMETFANLVAGQREYPFPDDLLKNIKMVEVTLDGTEWKRLAPFDLNSYKIVQDSRVKPYNPQDVQGAFANATTDEITITETFSDDYPMFDNDGKTITIYTESTIPVVTNGLKLRYSVYPEAYEDTDWTSTTDMSVRPDTVTTAIPRPAHEVLARKTILMFKESNSMTLNAFDMNFAVELENMKKKLQKPNLDYSVQPRIPRDTGFNY